MSEVKLNETTLADVVVISNTPTFLFERFRRDASVQELSRRCTALELAREAAHFAAEWSFENKVRAYAHIVALSFKPAPEIKAAVAAHPLPFLGWTAELLSLALANAPSAILVDVRIKPRIREASGTTPTVTSSTIITSAVAPRRIEFPNEPHSVSAEGVRKEVSHGD